VKLLGASLLFGAIVAASGEAWTAVGQIVGQVVIVLGGLATLLLTSYLNKTRKSRNRQGRGTFDRSMDDDSAILARDQLASMRTRNTTLTQQNEYLNQELTFTQRQLDFERRRNASLEQENDSAWQIIRSLRQELGRDPK
jgi:hypothetical protein